MFSIQVFSVGLGFNGCRLQSQDAISARLSDDLRLPISEGLLRFGLGKGVLRPKFTTPNTTVWAQKAFGELGPSKCVLLPGISVPDTTVCFGRDYDWVFWIVKLSGRAARVVNLSGVLRLD